MPEKVKENKKKRNRILIFFTIIMILTGAGYTVYYKMYGQFFESTNNAYVKQNITYITPQVAGVVDEVRVDTTQSVRSGEILGHIDATDIKLAFEKSKDSLAQSVRAIKQLYKQKDEAKASIGLAKVQVAKAKDDLDRKKILIKNRAISKESFNNFQYAYQSAIKNLEVVKKRFQRFSVILNDKKISQNPQIKKAVIELKQNYINLKRCDIISPISGVIAKKNFSVGSRVNTSTTLVAIVPKKGFWVEANFKETQLKNIKVGQKVKLYSDLYGKDVTYYGIVEGISAGTGSVFSLLPAQNATGNWIKIVQRLPVRIKLDSKELEKYPLHVGNSMEAIVDIHKQNEKDLKDLKIKKPIYKSNLYKNALNEAQQIADNIIKQNM